MSNGAPPAAEPEPVDSTFTQIGGSPAPGITLRHVLRGHAKPIARIAWSPVAALLASSSSDGTIRIWDARTGALARTLGDYAGRVSGVAWSPDGTQIAAAAEDRQVSLWDVATGKEVRPSSKYPGDVISLAWSPDGRTLAVGGNNSEIYFLDPVSGKVRSRIAHPGSSAIFDMHWSPDGRTLATAATNSEARLWDPTSSECLRVMTHHGAVDSVAWSPDGRVLVTASQDRTIRIWEAETGTQTTSLERHTGVVTSVRFSHDGRLLVSKAQDGTVLLWRCDTWDVLATLAEPTYTDCLFYASVAFHPSAAALATYGENDRIIRVWDLDVDALLGLGPGDTVQYTTARLVLVGDSGVGKTGLGWRLAHGDFKEHSSTHGQQFWAIPQLGLTRADGTECEAVLWDLAGQHVYRQIHTIFLENITAALIVFDPTNRQEPLKGVQFWIEQLKGKAQLPPAVLVGARVDRGAPAVSHQELEQFCQRYGINGGYVSTSAKSREGLDVLLERLKSHIPWDKMTSTVTSITFKRIKDHVLALKEKPDRRGVLVTPAALREQLEATDRGWRFSDAEMETAVTHLETHGYVTVLRNSAEQRHILLTPDLLVTLAASLVLLADKNARELGAVSETDLLQGALVFDELAGLSQVEAQILLDAAVLRFLQHNICFRETLGSETLLIFPGLIKQKRPLQEDLPSTDDISYVVRGRVENVYASLVVLLGYTPSFTRINQWQNQAQYEMGNGEICGFRLIEEREGEIELVLYYGDRMPARGRAQFQELFEQFLYQRDAEVTRFLPVVCPNGHRQERATVIKRVRQSKRFVFCDECGERAELPDFDQPPTIGVEASPWLQREEAAARLRNAYEVQLTRIKAYRRSWATPRCYLSHLPEQSPLARQLADDLRGAGVYVVDQAAQVQRDDVVVVIDTPTYQKAFRSRSSALEADTPRVRERLGTRQLVSLTWAGQAHEHDVNHCTAGDFSDETHYPLGLFNLVLTLFAIPLTHAAFAPLRATLHEQWEETLSRFAGGSRTQAPRIFISYAHADEEFKDELVKMLAGLQRRGIIDAWQDRRIEPGEAWFTAIERAIDESDMALLLVSADFLASPFINSEELPDLLERRRRDGMTVIPIIVRDCLWQSEPALKNLQALPTDGKAVIGFSKASGDRDGVWRKIAQAIEKIATERSTP